jgi:hypothetical protein
MGRATISPVPGIELIRSLFQQASAQGSRSTALNPLGWALALILSAMLGSVALSPPTWVLPFLATGAGIVIIAYVVAYFFLLFRDRDALRSERFQLSRLAIEKGFIGDNLSGVLKLDEGTGSGVRPIPDPAEGNGK